jgi:hypothetical protein
VDVAIRTTLKFLDSDLRAGARRDPEAGSCFFGLTDDVRIHDVALNAEAIAALAQ